jgi:polysaccharide biosynthesis transport protein
MNQPLDMHKIQSSENDAFRPEPEFDLIELFRKLNRRKSVILSIFILVMAITLLFISRQIPRYTAKATLMLTTRSFSVNTDTMFPGFPFLSEWAIASEMDIIRSRNFLERVVEKLNLTHDPLFNPKLRSNPEKSIWSELREWLKEIWDTQSHQQLEEKPDHQEKTLNQNPVDTETADASENPETQAAKLRRDIAGIVAGGLAVNRVQNSYTVQLSFSFPDPKRASEVVNAVADAYIMDQLDTKFESIRRSNEWLAERLNTLRQEVQAAEIAVQRVKQRGNLVPAKGTTLLEQQIAEINAQVVTARVNRSQAEARLKWVRENFDRTDAQDSVAGMMASTEIEHLRTEETTLRRRQAEMSSRYGPRHPEMLKITAELKDLQKKIKEETGRMMESLANEVEVSKAKEQALMQSLDEMKGQTKLSMQTELELAELERQAEVARTLYENFLSRFRQTREQEQIQKPDARIIGYADPPGSPSYPNKRNMLAGGATIGLMLGLMAAFLLELLDRGFRQSDQVELTTGHSVLGIIPALRKNMGDPVEYVVQKPLSSMAESIRAVRAAIQLSNVDRPPKTVLVTSALPNEGKSTFCVLLARVAAISGSKILLIDGDLRRPNLHKMLNLTPEARLEEVLAGEKEFKNAIVVDPKTGMHVISAEGHSANAGDLLGSYRMNKLIKDAEKEYDLIILDTPPIMGVSDTWGLAGTVDAVLFILRWAETPRETVRAALRQMDLLNVKVNGIVLSQVDLRQQTRYGYGYYGYYYGRYQKYYKE